MALTTPGLVKIPALLCRAEHSSIVVTGTSKPCSLQGAATWRIEWHHDRTVIYRTTAVTVLPRDAMHKRGLYRHSVSVRLSVCLSVTFVHSVKTN